MKNDLPYREESLNSAERKKLLKRFIGVLIFGTGMGFFLFWFMHFFDSADSLGGIAIAFEIFFFAILLFIISSHGLNAFQKNKRIYTGIITDKYGQSTKFKNSSQNQTFFIRLDDVEFRIDQFLFDQCHKGEHVELHVLGKSRIFKVTPLHSSAKSETKIEQNNDSNFANENTSKFHNLNKLKNRYQDLQEQLLSSESKKLNSMFIRALLLRGVIGIVVGTICFFILIIVLLFNIDFGDEQQLRNFDRIYPFVWMVSIGLYLLINLRTIRLLRDILNGKTKYTIEEVIDLERSNLPKPSRHSTVSYQGYTYRSDLFYYLRTNSFWIQITPELYESLKAGEPIAIKHTTHGKVMMDILIH